MKFSEKITQKLKVLTARPGVYLMKDKAGEIIYRCDGEEIGRADVLFGENVEKIGFGRLLAKILQALILA